MTRTSHPLAPAELEAEAAALRYAAAGLPVFPLHTVRPDGACSCGRECGKDKGKHPRQGGGFKNATTEENRVRNWWRAIYRGANIGIRTGEPLRSGGFLSVLDVDPRNDGDASLAEWEEEHGTLPDTFTVRTGGGGWHYYFRTPEPLPANARLGLDGLDVKSAGGYVIAPPSLHPLGRYELERSAPVADMPAAMFDRLKPKPKPDRPKRERTRSGTGAGGAGGGPLPWDEVKAADAAEVAKILELEDCSAVKGPRRYRCPVCNGRNLHAYAGADDPDGKSGFACYSNCIDRAVREAKAAGRALPGGVAYSTPDLAALVWKIEPAAACRRLADELDIPLPEPAAAAEGARVAETFLNGARRTNGRKPAPIPHRAGTARHAPTSRAARPEPAGFAELRAGGHTPRRPPTIYTAAMHALELTARGAEYLAGRGFDPVDAARYGFRSLDGPKDWLRLAEALRAEYLPEELEHAGFYARPKGDPARPPIFAPPMPNRGPALLIPYRNAGRVDWLHFRTLEPDGRVRYRRLRGTRAPLPFNADALHNLDGAELHIVEGELNAWALSRYRLRAIGLPGAGGWRSDAWAALLAPAARVVAWYDEDGAGRGERARLVEAITKRLGRRWLRERGQAARLPAGTDANELHQRGHLAELIYRAAWRD